MNVTSQSPKIPWKRIAVFAIILGIAAFQYFQKQNAEPGANQELANATQGTLELDPALADNKGTVSASKKKNSGNPGFKKLDGGFNKSSTNGSAKSSAAANRPSTNQRKSNAQKQTGPYLKPGKRGTKVSPAGLVYTQSRSGEHRTEHVLRHAEDQPNRSGSHGVFDANGDEVFRLIDEAYGMIKNKAKQVTKEKPRDGDFKTAYVIDMNRRIGYRGGQSGKRRNHPPLSKIKLILAENRVITAYPY